MNTFPPEISRRISRHLWRRFAGKDADTSGQRAEHF
jgi:hypothetical protein